MEATSPGQLGLEVQWDPRMCPGGAAGEPEVPGEGHGPGHREQKPLEQKQADAQGPIWVERKGGGRLRKKARLQVLGAARRGRPGWTSSFSGQWRQLPQQHMGGRLASRLGGAGLALALEDAGPDVSRSRSRCGGTQLRAASQASLSPSSRRCHWGTSPVGGGPLSPCVRPLGTRRQVSVC